jgi:hypothetical protein
VTVGLPLLDAMIPAWTALAQTAASPKPRMGFLYLPHGAIMDQWTPAAEGKSFELTPILKSVRKIGRHAVKLAITAARPPEVQPQAATRRHVDKGTDVAATLRSGAHSPSYCIYERRRIGTISIAGSPREGSSGDSRRSIHASIANHLKIGRPGR